jgi:phosphoribosyl-ATP pyrophosphohydrolase
MRPGDALARLAATIEARRDADPEGSWTARLLADPPRAARKFGEEAVEAVIEAVQGDRERLVSEAADVAYHLLVMCAAQGVTLSDIEAELARRDGRSGIEEKAARAEASVCRRSSRGRDAKARDLDRRATVLHDRHPGRAKPLGRRIVADPKLRPEGQGQRR